HNATQLFESVSEANPTRYYFFIGKSFAFANAVPIRGTVKTTSTSNTIVGQGTYFNDQREIKVGDRITVTGQYASGNSNPHIMRVHQVLTGQTMIVTPRPVSTITSGANAYIRKLWSEANPPAPTDSYQNIYYDIWRNMMSLKRVQQSDVSHVVTRHDWTNNQFYYEYKKDIDILKSKYNEDNEKLDEKIEELRCKEIKALLFDEYLRETNNEKAGNQSVTKFFTKKI
uniref:hypothetical protein n=1 Tax=Undibacterium luofuense TaxID=2828733 RepID=UPI0030EF4E35